MRSGCEPVGTRPTGRPRASSRSRRPGRSVRCSRCRASSPEASASPRSVSPASRSARRSSPTSGRSGSTRPSWPPLPFARTPVYLAVGAIRERALVIDGEIVVRPTTVLVATADHRLGDGSHAGEMVAGMKRLIADPDLMD
ncbi:2-oxo acid dehydrogenase subunit E2 [Nostocoides sp. F2B08]|uniref:2-oxo acid dehydrogenase subunit E2 n=1 Tax=Nostocoides sp. F2B08 TaxID=2653936 RepID=UPI00186B3F7A|nr:2-oxo acid dehydrogenase subunit E2 [Tetrasphaera sp. F2B08]